MTFSTRLKILLVFFTSISFGSNGQDAWQSLTISDGLSQGMVNDMIQDRQGFMWFATKDGLNRYDGYNFKVFTRDPYNPTSISGNFCTALLEDSKGRIWIGTEKDGLNLFDPKTQRFTHISISDSNLKGVGNYEIDYLKEDENGSIWVITRHAGRYFKIEASHLSAQTGRIKIEKVIISDAKQTPRFVSDRHALERPHAQSIYQFDASFRAQQRHLGTSVFIMKDSKGCFWATGLGYIMSWEGNALKKIIVPKEDVPRLNLLRDGRVAVCFNRNVWILKDYSELTATSFLPRNAINRFHSTEHPDTKLYGPVSNIYLDRQSNIWASNQGYGVIKLNRYTQFFRSFLPQASPGPLYQSAHGNVYFHGNFRPTYHYYELIKAENRWQRLPGNLYEKKQEHESLIQDRDQNFWLTIWNGQRLVLQKYSVKWQLLKSFPLLDSHYGNQRNAKLIQDHAGNIWIGHVNGILLKLDQLTGQFISYNYNSIIPKNRGLTETLALYEDGSKILWIGTQAGLIKADHFYSNPTFSISINNSKDRQSLSENVVSGMVDDPLLPHHYLWVSTKGGGLERMDKRTGNFEHFNETRGLPNKVVYGVLVGRDGNLWMGTNRGIACLNPKTFVFTNFNKSDGLQDDEFNTASYFGDSTGELLFGGVKGITTFRPTDLQKDSKTPILKILGLKINNQIVEAGDKSHILKNALEYTTALDLDFDQNQVSIEFALMDFTNASKNRFKYQLEGIDQDWVEAGTNHMANFAQLPYGQYTFRVQGTANGEVWSKPVALKVRINTPFYLTWWAYLLYILIACFIFYDVYRNQVKRAILEKQIIFKEKETARLAELDQLKTNFFTSISHEFRTPLTLIAGPIDDLQKKYPREEMLPSIRRNALRLLTLMNQLLDLSKLDAREMQLDVRKGDLAQFIQYLASSFESYAASLSIDFQFYQNEPHFFTVFDADKIEKILTNLLSNAFKFTPGKGRVDLQIEYRESYISIVLKDTGVGIAQEKLAKIFERFYQVDHSMKRNYEGTGIGLALVKELVNLMQGTIRVESQVGFGTSFFLKIPMEKEPMEQLQFEIYTISHDKSVPLQMRDHGLLSSDQKGIQLDQNANILLIVDDNPDLRAYLRTIFENDYQIIEATNGKEGLELSLTNIPDIVISDLMMPIMDGFEFCKLLKTNEKTSHIPVILLTAKATLEDRMEGLDLGADDYLLKPFNAAEVKTRVKNLIAIREQLKIHYTQSILRNSIQPSEISSLETPFIKKVKEALEQEYSCSQFDVESLAQIMNMSSSQLLRKLKALTNLTTVEFIREYRLQKAAELLSQKAATVSEVAYQTGFESLSYFTKVFHQKYKKLPSEY